MNEVKEGCYYRLELDKDGNILRQNVDLHFELDQDDLNLLKKLAKLKLVIKYDEEQHEQMAYILNRRTGFFTFISLHQTLFYMRNPNCLPHILNSCYQRFGYQKMV